MSSIELVTHRIRGQIASGQILRGTKLPKIAFIAHTHGVSTATVVSALRVLEGEGCIHKTGKSWICGGRPRPPEEPRAESWNSIILLLHTPNLWKSLHNPRCGDFCRRIEKEALEAHVQLRYCITEHTGEISGGFNHRGRKGFGNLAGSLGSKYLGTLIPCDSKMLPDLLNWIHFTKAFKRPTVWFDCCDEDLEAKDIAKPKGLFYRCHYSESATVCEIVSSLQRYGHRKIGYIGMKEEPWVRSRLRMLRSVSEARNLGMEFIDANTQDHTTLPVQEIFSSILGPRLNKKLLQTPAERDSAIAEVLHRGATVLLAANDHVGVRLLPRLLDLGFQIPSDVSFLSVDNTPSVIPMSSISSGFDYLGYAALHTMLNDIPNTSDKWGNIAAQPRLFDRGTLGRSADPGSTADSRHHP